MARSGGSGGFGGNGGSGSFGENVGISGNAGRGLVPFADSRPSGLMGKEPTLVECLPDIVLVAVLGVA